ncbi:MAG: hypothetical protein LUQ65_01280 [Candidatus Helarchaeota archaeon]|nr:hypothetical protein [Candidatus Helarchaeota archaeon]
MVEFPIEEPYRELLLNLEVVILFTCLELSIFFLFKYWRNRKESNPSIVELDWGIIFFSFGVANIFYILSDFYELDRLLFSSYGYFCLAIGIIIFLFHIEYKKMLNTRFILTISFAAYAVTVFIIFLIAPSLMKTAIYSCAIFAFGIVFSYLIVIIKRIWNNYRAYSLGLFSGTVLFMLGFAATSDIAINVFNGFWIRGAGDIAIFIGLLLIGFFLSYIPSLAEIGWQDKIKYIIFTTQNGVGLYSENFREKKEINEVLVAGALWGIQVFLKTILIDSHLKVLSKGSDVILMEYGQKIVGILIVQQELEILKSILKKMVMEFEQFYATILQNWDGDLKIFRPTRHLIAQLFSTGKI